MSRTVMTATTVFLVVTVLLIFGGDVLRGFSVAMFIGVVFGAYSSIFVAAPIVIDLGTSSKPKK
jgi:SecD/SecF fusion protein